MSLDFSNAMSFNGNVSGWDMSPVTSMNSKSNAPSDFSQDLIGWSVSNTETRPASSDTLTYNWSEFRSIWVTCLSQNG